MTRAYAGVSIDDRHIKVRVCDAKTGAIVSQTTQPSRRGHTPIVALIAHLIDAARQGHDVRTLTVAVAGIVEQGRVRISTLGWESVNLQASLESATAIPSVEIRNTATMGAIGEYSMCVDKPRCLAYVDWSSHFFVGYTKCGRHAEQLDISHKQITNARDARRYPRNWESILEDLCGALSLVIELTGCDKIILGGILTARLEQGYIPVQNRIEDHFRHWQNGKHRQVSLVSSGYGEAVLVGAALTARMALR